MSPEPLKAQFFVTRQNGNMVPLIAMDELPLTINIRGVSRTLSPQDLCGMTGIGAFEARHLQHVVETPTTSRTLIDRSLNASKYAGFDQHLRPVIAAVSYDGPPKAYGIHEQAPSTPLNPIAPSYHTPNPYRVDRNAHPLPPWHDTSSLPLHPAPGVKEYCSYWLRHGECDYAQQGCLYKHEMPLDQPTLQRLGLRDIPRWYREKHGLGSYLAVSSALGGVDDKKRKEEMMDKNWRKGSPDHSNNIRSSSQATASTPVCPPSTPQHVTRIMAKCQPKAMKMPSVEPVEPKDTLHERQNRETIAQQEAYERKERQRKAELQNRINAAKLGEHPSTSSSSSRSSLAPTPTPADATPATSTEGSDNELGLSPIKTISMAALQPFNETKAQALPTGPANRGKKRIARRNRRRVAAESDDEAEEMAMGANACEVEVKERKYQGAYDHDD